MKRGRGRPSKYTEDMPEKLIKYFSAEPYFDSEKEIATSKGVVTVTIQEASDFPTLAGFAIECEVDRDTLKEWAKVHKDFSAAYKRAKEYQERFLTVNAMKGLINPTFAIFTAKNVLGWRDVRDDKAGDDDKPAVLASVYKLHDGNKSNPKTS